MKDVPQEEMTTGTDIWVLEDRPHAMLSLGVKKSWAGVIRDRNRQDLYNSDAYSRIPKVVLCA